MHPAPGWPISAPPRSSLRAPPPTPAARLWLSVVFQTSSFSLFSSSGSRDSYEIAPPLLPLLLLVGFTGKSACRHLHRLGPWVAAGLLRTRRRRVVHRCIAAITGAG